MNVVISPSLEEYKLWMWPSPPTILPDGDGDGHHPQVSCCSSLEDGEMAIAKTLCSKGPFYKTIRKLDPEHSLIVLLKGTLKNKVLRPPLSLRMGICASRFFFSLLLEAGEMANPFLL